MPNDVLLYADDRMVGHDPGAGHPERPQRLEAVHAALRPLKGVRWIAPEPATPEQVGRVHAPRYVESIAALRGSTRRLDPDTVVSPASVDAAFLAAGAVVQAVDAVTAEDPESTRAFALVRPPGHHAEPARAMGFCLFNNVAVAAAHALATGRVRRVLVVDWDVHHGNGTQHAFYESGDVLFFSVHQFPFYPGTGRVEELGRGEGAGRTVNVPLPGGQDDGDYAAVFREVLLPVADAFVPDLVLVSAGFDAHRDDPLGGMELTAEGFAGLCGVVRDVADRHAGGRLLLTLEGGYDLDALGQSARACVEVLSGATPPASSQAAARTEQVIRAVHGFQRRFWRF